MKKFTKIFSVVALCTVMVIMSVVPAFASDNPFVENHSVIDCIHRYKDNDGYFYFVIKVPKEMKKTDVSIAVTKNSDGDEIFRNTFEAWNRSLTYSYSDDTSDYYIFKTTKIFDAGIGIKIYYRNYDKDIYYMATDTAIGSTVEGRGYWLGA